MITNIGICCTHIGQTKKKQQMSGEGSITWEYFEMFDNILGHKESSHPNQANLGLSITLNESQKSSSSNFEEESSNLNNINEREGQDENGKENQPPSRKRKLEILSMGRYLFLKNKRN